MTTLLFSRKRPLLVRLGLVMTALLFVIPGAALVTASAHAQGSSAAAPSSGAAPVLGSTVQGQSAGTPESALRTAMNYLGNVICPIVSVAFFVLAILQYRSGKGVAAALITACSLLAVSGIVRYAESLVY